LESRLFWTLLEEDRLVDGVRSFLSSELADMVFLEEVPVCEVVFCILSSSK
jgi:hypothetical protein